jgi:GTP-binding protein
MRIKNAELLKICTDPKDYPPAGPPEIAFCGRSNVGKSSLLNFLTNRKALARTSSSPGKTRTINFYSVNGDKWRIVDLPGYGYAKVSKTESGKWGKMIEDYLTGRDTLAGSVLLADIRHKPSAQDVQMYEWLMHYGLAGLVVATKADKISKSRRAAQVSQIKKTLAGGGADMTIIPVSALEKTGADELLSAIETLL